MEVLLVCGFFYVGLVYAQLLEWVIHKHLLHKLGKGLMGSAANSVFKGVVQYLGPYSHTAQ